MPAEAEIKAEGVGARLFVAATVAQTRNAAHVAAETAERGPASILLALPGSNPELAARMKSEAARHPFDLIEYPAPRAPLRPVLRNMRRHRAGLRPLLRGGGLRELWLANAEGFLGWLAREAHARGAAVNLFEDGLSSYRQAGDPSWRRPGFIEQARRSRGALAAASRQGEMGREVGDQAQMLLLASPLGALWSAATGAEPFIERWRRFDEAWLAFPEAFPRGAAEIGGFRNLPLAPSPRALAAARDALAPFTPGLPELYVSQIYDRAEHFHDAAAKALAAAGAGKRGALLVKHHPRETTLQRESLLAALERNGVAAHAPRSFDGIEDEALFAAGGLGRVFGLTSTSLLHLARPDAPAALAPIGRQTCALMEAAGGAPARLRSDLALFERVAAALRAK